MIAKSMIHMKLILLTNIIIIYLQTKTERLTISILTKTKQKKIDEGFSVIMALTY